CASTRINWLGSSIRWLLTRHPCSGAVYVWTVTGSATVRVTVARTESSSRLLGRRDQRWVRVHDVPWLQRVVLDDAGGRVRIVGGDAPGLRGRVDLVHKQCAGAVLEWPASGEPARVQQPFHVLAVGGPGGRDR